MKRSKSLLAVVLALVVALVVAGCGSGGSSGSSGDNSSKTLTLGNIGWTENIAINGLTKVILEEDLGYQEVELQTLDLGLVFEGVGGGDVDAFQDVWMPNHEALLSEVENDVEHLDPWYQGETAFGLAVPSYMEDVNSIADLNQSGVDRIIGIEPGAILVQKTEDDVIPAYNLDLELEASSTAAMLSEVSRLYPDEEPFVFMGWSPHWMNTEYDFKYLEDPKNAQGNLDEPAKISSIVNEDLEGDDPVAYAFLNEISLTEEDLNSLEDEILAADDDAVAGATAWLEQNRDVVKPAIDAAKQAQ